MQKGKLAIAANEFTALYLLPVLAEFRRLHPMIKITVQRSLGSQIPDDLLRHNVEFGVLTYEPQEPRLRSIVVYLDELIFVVPPQASSGRRNKSASASWVPKFSSRTSCLRLIAKKSSKPSAATKRPSTWTWNSPPCRPSHASSRWATESRSSRRSACENELARGELVGIPVRELRLHRKLRLVYRKEASLSHAGRAFLQVAEAIATERQGQYRFLRDH